MRLAVPLALAALLAHVAPVALALPLGGDACEATTTVETPSNAFTPSCIVIASGDVVTWVNVGGRPHQLTSDEPAPVTAVTGEPCIQSGVYDIGESVALRFERQGDSVTVDGRPCTLLSYDLVALAQGEIRIPYHCTLHGNMKGEIVVR